MGDEWIYAQQIMRKTEIGTVIGRDDVAKMGGPRSWAMDQMREEMRRIGLGLKAGESGAFAVVPLRLLEGEGV